MAGAAESAPKPLFPPLRPGLNLWVWFYCRCPLCRASGEYFEEIRRGEIVREQMDVAFESEGGGVMAKPHLYLFGVAGDVMADADASAASVAVWVGQREPEAA